MDLFQRAFEGYGLDIGAGPDPLHPQMGFTRMLDCEPFDVQHGDANKIDELLQHESYDFVHASQCLEHMHDPVNALYRWLRLVKPGGYMVFSVPDWELYEGCRWPSLHNHDHKSAWGMGPLKQSQCAVQVPYFDILRLLSMFEKVQVMLVQQVDTRFDYRQFGTTLDQTLSCNAEAFIEVVLWKRNHFFTQ